MTVKQNENKLIERVEEPFVTELWWNAEANRFEINRNSKVVMVLTYHGYVIYDDMEEQAKCDFHEWLDETDKGNITLNEYLKRNNIQLTQLELRCLHCILGEGSFYEESSYAADERRKYGQFFGWEITESEVPGCRGALASLVKKGIINIVEEYDDMSAYYTYLGFEFVEGGFYHELKLDAENVK